MPEPGRRIVEQELRQGGHALPWVDLAAFARRAIALAAADRAIPDDRGGRVFFDRGLVDAAVALQHAGGAAAVCTLRHGARYHRQVFMTPPWPEIFAADAERRHGLADAIGEYHRLLAAYRALGYETVLLPKVGVVERADFVLRHLR